MRLGDILTMDLYSALGVGPDATSEEIRRAYRRLVMVSHPDLNHDDRARAEHRTVELNVAASVLLDPARRRAYDRARAGLEGSPRPCNGPWDFWRTSADMQDWVAAARDLDPAPRGELWDTVRGFRSWPSQTLLMLLRKTAATSASGHALITVASVGFALLLISMARPRSLTPLLQPETAVAARGAPRST